MHIVLMASISCSSPSFGFRSACTLFCFSFSIFFLPFTYADHFQINHFDRYTASIFYEGDAKPSNGAINFNMVSYGSRVGRATYTKGVHLWDSNSAVLSDFSTIFSFSIDTLGLSSNYGHGLSFFLAPVNFQFPPNSAGGFLGLYNTTNSGLYNITNSRDTSQSQIVAVEFDSFANLDWDPPFEHVGINNNSISSSVFTPWNASLHSGNTAHAQISYNATDKNLSVSWTYEANPSSHRNSSLSYQIDLMEVLSEWVSIGFSASTGQNVERHTLYSWEFRSSLDIKQRSGGKLKQEITVGLTVSLSFLLLGGLGTFLIWRRQRSFRGFIEIVNDLDTGAGPRRYSYGDLALATNNFSDERKLGEGGFGCVYKGFLTDLDMAVAVKKISRESKQGKKEYVMEVKILNRLRHRNLVQLIGWCHDQSQFLIVYEFMPNGSLDSHLQFGKKCPLVWALRYKIALGLASALLYLHEEWEQCVVHRDIKSSNIMLDSGFNVKLGDFGLARLMDHELGPQTTVVAGTLGYMAPEYVTTGKASKESDIYSFGVVALEIACGRKCGFVDWVWELHGGGLLVSAVDKRLNLDFDANQVECLMKVGLWCAHPDRTMRPSMRQVIQVLNFEASMPDLPTKMPVPTFCPPATPAVTSRGTDITLTSFNTGR